MENGSFQTDKLVALMRSTLTEDQQQQLNAAGLGADQQLSMIRQFELMDELGLSKENQPLSWPTSNPTASPGVTNTNQVVTIGADRTSVASQQDTAIPDQLTGVWVEQVVLTQLTKDATQTKVLMRSLQQCQESNRQKDEELEQMQSRLAKAQLQPSADQLAQRLAPLLSAQLDLSTQAQQALDTAVAQAANTSLTELLTQTHRRIDLGHGPAIVTRTWLVRLQWGFYSSLILLGLLTGLLVLSHHRAAYFAEGFYKYETVRYRALLPGYHDYHAVYRDVEGLWAKPNFMDRLAGIEALYNRIGKPDMQSASVGNESKQPAQKDRMAPAEKLRSKRVKK